MSSKVQQSVFSDCVTYEKSRIVFNYFNTFNNVKLYERTYYEEVIKMCEQKIEAIDALEELSKKFSEQ